MTTQATAHQQYLLRLADNALILAQRLGEWCGHGPILEEDLSLTNTALDLIGQARLLYSHAAKLAGENKTEDDYAYWRGETEFRNWTLVELPNSAIGCGTVQQSMDYAITIARNTLFSALMVEVWQAIATSSDVELAAIAAKSIKEARYHLRHAADWLIRFGDGTAESHQRAQTALDALMPYTNEIFQADAVEEAVAAAGVAPTFASLQPAWQATMTSICAEATLTLNNNDKFRSTGKQGIHSEHMGFLLAEMQSITRQHPGATW